ncbi:MAG: YlxR family protein [Christensenellaceae bacterium]|nr:YlxR family protein [Christensenellaceae bacterium]
MEKQRICCCCRKRFDAKDLIRVYREKTDNGFKFAVDEKGNANGRGASVCRECITKAIKTRAFNRSFKTGVPEQLYTELSLKLAPTRIS